MNRRQFIKLLTAVLPAAVVARWVPKVAEPELVGQVGRYSGFVINLSEPTTKVSGTWSVFRRDWQFIVETDAMYNELKNGKWSDAP